MKEVLRNVHFLGLVMDVLQSKELGKQDLVIPYIVRVLVYKVLVSSENLLPFLYFFIGDKAFDFVLWLSGNTVLEQCDVCFAPFLNDVWCFFAVVEDLFFYLGFDFSLCCGTTHHFRVVFGSVFIGSCAPTIVAISAQHLAGVDSIL